MYIYYDMTCIIESMQCLFTRCVFEYLIAIDSQNVYRTRFILLRNINYIIEYTR